VHGESGRTNGVVFDDDDDDDESIGSDESDDDDEEEDAFTARRKNIADPQRAGDRNLNPTSMYMLAVCQLELGDFNRGHQCLSHVTAYLPHLALGHIRLANLLVQVGLSLYLSTNLLLLSVRPQLTSSPPSTSLLSQEAPYTLTQTKKAYEGAKAAATAVTYEEGGGGGGSMCQAMVGLAVSTLLEADKRRVDIIEEKRGRMGINPVSSRPTIVTLLDRGLTLLLRGLFL
jgi:hypothetical protein